MGLRQNQEDQQPQAAQQEAGSGEPLPSREAQEREGRSRGNRPRGVVVMMVVMRHTVQIERNFRSFQRAYSILYAFFGCRNGHCNL